MHGEQSVRSDEASKIRKLLEQPSPDSTFSPRSELLSDADSHKARRAKTHRTSSHRRHRSHRDRDRDQERHADGTALEARQLSRLLVHDELEAVDMRRLLYNTSDRLEHETRRANEAEARAREAEARALAIQATKQAAQATAIHEQETLKAYQLQLDAARNEILRAQKELDSMAADKERAEEEAARDRSKARAMAKEIEIQLALEKGRQEGKKQGFVDGRKEGWYIGTRDGRKEAIKEMMYYDDAGSVTSQSSITPPLTSSGNQPPISFPSTVPHSAGPTPAPVDLPTPVQVTQNLPRATSTRTVTPQTKHKRSGSLTQSIKSRLRGASDPKPPIVAKGPVPEVAPVAISRPARTVTTPENLAEQTRFPQRFPSSSTLNPQPPRGSSPIPFHNAPPSPRHTPTSPLPGGYIPLQENGRVSLPPPHEIEPPPSPHSPAAPLPPVMPPVSPGHNLQPPNNTANIAPTITVQEPTPPEPLATMPEPHPAPAPLAAQVVTENNVKPSRVLARDYAFGARAESPPLPPLPSDRPNNNNKGKQRQRTGPPRAGAGLHAPGRSSPSDTSTEFSQFDIVEQPERNRILGRGNGSQLSVIMEGGSTAAESPEPTPIKAVRSTTPRMGARTPTGEHATGGAPLPASQGILNDPREYGDFAEGQLSPSQLAHRRAVADQLRWGSPGREGDARHGVRGIRDDVSIKSSTTRASAPRRRPNVKMPERLGGSKIVEELEKQAEIYGAFGTGQFPSFDSQSSPEEVAVSTRTPEFRKGHRRAMSSATSVPEITIQPPSRPSSKASKVSSLAELGHMPMPAPTTPSRRHTMQESPVTPSRVPLPHTGGHIPMSLGSPHLAEFDLPPGFVPTQGPPGVMEALASGRPSKTPKKNVGGLPASGPGGSSNIATRTPAGVPLPLSTATIAHGLPDNVSSAPRGTGRTLHNELPATAYEPAPVPPGFQYPPGFTPARVPLPESIAGGSPRPSNHQTPWSGWNNLAAGATPGPSMPASLNVDRPMSLYAGDGGPKKKVSSSSLASSYKKYESSTYLDPAYLASADSVFRGDPQDDERVRVETLSRAGSVHSTIQKRRSLTSVTVEDVTDEDEPPHTPKV